MPAPTAESERPARPTAGETNLYSEGAEFLVLGNLLIRGLHASKAYTRYPGWDLLVSDPATGRTCRVQVKARLATDFDFGFPIKNFEAEFVVLVALNRGYRYGRRRSALDDGVRDPEFYVLPMTLVKAACSQEDAPSWGSQKKVYIKRQIPDWESFRGNWQLVVDEVMSGRNGVDA